MVFAFVAGFLVAGAFLTTDLVAGFLAAGLVAGAAFLTAAMGLTPEDLASLAREALRREAVFFLRRPFLTALSSSDWALLREEAEGLV